MADIPVELFLGFIGISFILIVIGIVRRPMIPALIVFAGMFILAISMVTDNIVFGSRIDNIVATESTFNITTSTVSVPDYSYSVLSQTTTQNLDAGGANRFVTAIFVSPTSQLIGENIECVSFIMSDVGTASASSIRVGIFDANANLVLQIGSSKLASTLTAAFSWENFCFADDPDTEPQSYTIQANDRIGIQYPFDTTGNGIAVRLDNMNPFDSTNTYRQGATTTTWVSSTGDDLTAQLFRIDEIPNDVQVSGIGGVYSYEPDTFEFTEMPKVMFAFFSVVLMLVGALITKMEN